MRSPETYRREADEVEALGADSIARLFRDVAQVREDEPQVDALDHLSRGMARIGIIRYKLGGRLQPALADEVESLFKDLVARIHIAQDELAGRGDE